MFNKKILPFCFFCFFTFNLFSQETAKTDITLGYHSVFTNLEPVNLFKPRIFSNGTYVFNLQLNRTILTYPAKSPWLKIKTGASAYNRDYSPIVSWTNTFQLDLLRKVPDTFTVGIESNLQVGKWFIKKYTGDRYSLAFFSIYGAFRPNKHFNRFRIRYRYDITPFYYSYFAEQDVNSTFTYQKGFSLEYTFKTKKQNGKGIDSDLPQF